MTIGALLLFAAYLITAATAAVCLLDLWRPGRATARYVVPALHGTATALLLLVLFLAALFLIGDTSFAYVWRNVDLSYPWHQRLSGVWVGREGSLLLWTAATALFLSIDELRHGRASRTSPSAAIRNAFGAGPHRPRTSERPWPGQPVEATNGSEAADLDQLLRNRRVVRVLLSLLVLLLVTVLVDESLFAATDPDDLMERPGGRGVNPQLVTLYNTIHPPIVLTGYALTALPAAFAIAHLATGARGWIGPARRWGHLAFLFLTAGVILGALWAYIALGWGGYWAWDPVEVGILVPWTVITAFLHAGLRYDERGEFAIAAPTLALLGFSASMFSTFIVRAGGIWVSVHSFLGAGDAQDAWGRFLAAYDSNLEVKLYTWLLGLSVAAVLPLLLIHVQRIDNGRIWPGPSRTARETHASATQRLLQRLDLRTHFLVGVLLLSLLATVIVTILIVGIDGFGSDAARTATFESRTGPLALLAVTIMSMAIGIGFLSRVLIIGLHAGALVVGALLGLLIPGPHQALTMAVTVLAVASGVALLRAIHAIRTYEGHRAWRITGTHLVHLGVAVVLIGHGVVSAFATEERIVEFQIGESHRVEDQWVQLVDIERLDRDDNGGFDTITASFLVWEDTARDANSAQTPPNEPPAPPADAARVDIGFGYYESTDHYKPHVGIQRDVLRDLYLAPRGVHDPMQDKWVYSNLPLFQQGARELMDADAVTVGVSTLPYINLVWAGSTLMVLGAMGIVVSSQRFRPWTDGTDRRGAGAGEDRTVAVTSRRRRSP